MGISITHTTTAGGTDSGDGKISKNAWNEAHTISGNGWTEIANVATTSGTTAGFTSIPATYSNLLVVFEGISFSTNATLRLELSADGSTYSTAAAFTFSMTSSSAFDGGQFFPNYNHGYGMAVSTIATDAASPMGVASGSTVLHIGWRVTGGIDAIRYSPSAGNFDAGAIRLFGKS